MSFLFLKPINATTKRLNGYVEAIQFPMFSFSYRRSSSDVDSHVVKPALSLIIQDQQSMVSSVVAMQRACIPLTVSTLCSTNSQFG